VRLYEEKARLVSIAPWGMTFTSMSHDASGTATVDRTKRKRGFTNKMNITPFKTRPGYDLSS
jgi:hypothetical protein